MHTKIVCSFCPFSTRISAIIPLSIPFSVLHLNIRHSFRKYRLFTFTHVVYNPILNLIWSVCQVIVIMNTLTHCDRAENNGRSLLKLIRFVLRFVTKNKRNASDFVWQTVHACVCVNDTMRPAAKDDNSLFELVCIGFSLFCIWWKPAGCDLNPPRFQSHSFSGFYWNRAASMENGSVEPRGCRCIMQVAISTVVSARVVSILFKK